MRYDPTFLHARDSPIQFNGHRCQNTAMSPKFPICKILKMIISTYFFGEAGMIDTIKLYNSVIATGDLVFNFVRCI